MEEREACVGVAIVENQLVMVISGAYRGRHITISRSYMLRPWHTDVHCCTSDHDSSIGLAMFKQALHFVMYIRRRG